MAIQIKTSITPHSIFTTIGVNADDMNWLAKSPILVKATPLGISFFYPGQSQPEATVAFSTSDLMSIAGNKLPGSSAYKYVQLIHKVVSTLQANHFMVSSEDTAPVPLNEANLKKAFSENVKEQMFPEPAAKWPITSKAAMSKNATVKLRDAHAMYQPVQGTSQGSRYFVVAGNDDLRVAARWNANTLSVRIEGQNLKKHIAAVGNVFGGVNTKNMYASLHLEVGTDPILANKTLGAILLGLGIEFDTPFPNASVIKGL